MSRYLSTLMVTVALLWASLPARSQNLHSITGRVEDRATGRALAFASIYLQGSNISNVSNVDGLFSLKFSSLHSADTVIVSHLGYRTIKRAIADFGAEESLFLLEPTVVSLNPVVIRPQDALSVVKIALSRVANNYSSKPLQMTTFYREMIRKGSRYVSLNEAVLDLYKAPYRGYRADQIAIYKARGNYDKSRVDTIMIKFQGGPNSALAIDLVKDPFLGVDPQYIDEIYSFKFGDPTTVDNRLLYLIEFDEKRIIEGEIYFRGKIYIEPESFAIARVEFSMNVEGRKEANNFFIKKKPLALRMDVLEANYLVNYKNRDSLWYFDYSRTEVKFNSRWRRKLFSTNYTISSEIAVTDISSKIREIDPKDRIRARDVISNRVSDYSDPNFWGEYNIIEPEQSIERVIARIVKQLNREQ